MRLRPDFRYPFSVGLLRIDGFQGEQYLAVKRGKLGLELLQLILFFPCFIHDLLQDGNFLFNVSIVPRVFLNQAGDAVESVDEVPAGGLRVGCQASVVVIVQEFARAAHEEAVLAEVQSLLDGGVGLDHDFEAVEGADGNRLAVRALLVLYLVQPGGYDFGVITCYPVYLQRVEFLALLVILHAALEVGHVLPRPRDDVAVGGLVGQQGLQPDARIALAALERLALALQSGNLLLQTRLVQEVGVAGEDGDILGVVHAPFLVHAALVDGAAAHAVLLELGDEKLLVVEQVELVAVQ